MARAYPSVAILPCSFMPPLFDLFFTTRLSKNSNKATICSPSDIVLRLYVIISSARLPLPFQIYTLITPFLYGSRYKDVFGSKISKICLLINFDIEKT